MKKLVQFKDGRFGVRKGNWLIGYSFLDLRDYDYWWNILAHVNKYCRGTKEEAAKGLQRVTDIGKEVE